MSRRAPSRKRSAQILATAALAGLVPKPARGDLSVDLRALPGVGYTVTSGGKNVTASGSVTVNLALYAIVSGTNSVQQTGNFDGESDAPDTRNDETLTVLAGVFTSGAGGLRGNYNPTPGEMSYPTAVPPYQDNGFQNGTALDYDSDGDLDIGKPGTDVTTMFAAAGFGGVSGLRATAALIDGVDNGWTWQNQYGLDPDDKLISASTMQMHLADLQFTLTGGSGSASLNFILRTGTGATAAWFEDGITTQKTPTNGLFSIGAPVVIVPEPASAALGVAGLASLGLLARRRPAPQR